MSHLIHVATEFPNSGSFGPPPSPAFFQTMAMTDLLNKLIPDEEERPTACIIIHHHGEPSRRKKSVIKFEQNNKKVTEVAKDVKCKICMTNDINCVLKPCSHATACRKCAYTMLKRNDACPICNTMVKRVTMYQEQILVTNDEEEEKMNNKRKKSSKD